MPELIKVLYFTDVHYSRTNPRARKDDYGEAIRTKMAEVAEISKKFEPDAVLFGGDLTHKKAGVTMAEAKDLIEMIKDVHHLIYGILGSHDVTGHQVSSADRRVAGVLEAADVIRWIPAGVNINIEGINVRGEPCHVDYESPKSYGVKATKIKEDGPTIWLSHGALIKGKKLPFDCTNVEDILDTKADIVLNGHYHSVPWVVEENEKLIINAGSIGRDDIGDDHKPSVVLLVFKKTGDRRHKIVQLKSVVPHKDVFERIEKSEKASDDDITEFVEALQTQSGDVRTEDVKAAVEIGCQGKDPEVKTAVLERLGV